MENTEVSERHVYSPPIRFLSDRTSICPPLRYELNFAQHIIPETFQEAVTRKDSNKWKQAIKDKLEAHKQNTTWTLVSKPEKQKIIYSKWVFKVLQDSEGKYKARLCACDFQQQFGVNLEKCSHRDTL